MVKTVIGVDLGGTAIKIGKFDQEGNCLESLTLPTPQPATPKEVALTIHQGICQVNLEEESTGMPTILANDANCAGLGEAWLGAGKRFQNLILLTLGTGVGGAIILDGNLFVGSKGTAAELGLITLNFDGPLCNSGNQGSLEQYTSLQAIRRMTGKEPKQLAELAEKGDREALEFWQGYGCLLGAGIASLLYVLTPEAVIIGGGISASAKFFFPSLLTEIERRVLPSSREGLEVLTAELGNRAGMVGAAKLAWQLVDLRKESIMGGD